jgi:hypothetical protein
LQANTRRRRPLAHLARHRAAAAALALGLLGAACASTTEASPTAPSATFRRAQGAAFQFGEPSAAVRDLLPPSGDVARWTVVGSVFDPASRTSVAATWESEDGRSWDRHDVEPTSGDSEAFSAAVATDAGRLAVGWAGEGTDSDAAVWREEEGEWVRLGDPVFGGDHPQWAFDVAVGDGGTVVAGGESVWGQVRPRMWFSPDGETWESVDGGPDGPFGDGASSVRAVAAIDNGFVAVGSRTVDNDQDGAAWYSADGRTWEALDAPTLGGPGRQGLLTVADAGDVVVAGGFVADESDQGKPVVWRSRGGQDWGGASAPLALYDDDRTNAADLSVQSLAVGEGGITAAGGSDWRPHLWRSTDAGVSWRALTNPVSGGLFKDGVALASAATREGVTVAVGHEPTAMRLEQERWLDTTGDSFPKGGVRPFVTSVAAGKDTILAVGGRYTPTNGGERESYEGHVWQRGGEGWSEVKTDRLGDGQILDIAPFAGGFVAVGFEDFGRAAERTIGEPSPNGLIWTSADGKDWKRIAAKTPNTPKELLEILAENDSDALAGVIAAAEIEQPLETDPPAGGEGTRSLDAVAPLGEGFIAVGVAFDQNKAQPLVGVSDDGKAIRGENADFDGDGTRPRRFTDVCVSPDGEAIAVGVSGTEGDINLAVRRRDPEGAWTRGTSEDESFDGPGDQQVEACAASDEGFVIVGSDNRSGNRDARIWKSTDGVTWTRLTSGTLGGPGDQDATAVSAIPDGGWLVGGSDTATGTADAALWQADTNGDVTRRDQGEASLGGPGDQSVSSLLVTEDHVYVVGQDHGRVGVWESNQLDR